MNKNYLASCELGPVSSNIIVMSYHNDNIYLVAKASIDTPYIEQGKIIDKDNLTKAIKQMLDEIKNIYKIDIDKIILSLPSVGNKMYQASVSNTILTEKQIIGKHQIDVIRNKMLNSKVSDDEVIVLEVPRLYILSENRVLRTPPINYQSPTLSIKSNIYTLPTNVVNDIYDIFNELGIEIIGKYPNVMSNINACVSPFELEDNTICVNIGQDYTTISAYAKNIMLHQSYVIRFGFVNLINYLQDALRVSTFKARELIESYFTFNIDLASNVQIDTKKEISPKRICAIILNRISNYMSGIKDDIIHLAKDNEFEDYNIFITGKLNDFDGFDNYFINQTKLNVLVKNSDIIGIDSQKYIGAIGSIKLYINDNKDLMDEKDNQDIEDEIEINNDNKDIDNKEDNSRFRDIFMDE